MREKNKIKIVLSLLIAVAFLLPASSVIGSDVQSIDENKASAVKTLGQYGEPEIMKLDSPVIALDDDGCYPVDITAISLNGIYHESNDIIRTGVYELDTMVCQQLYDPCLGIWSLVAVDNEQEVLNANTMAPMEIYMMTDGTNLFINFSNLGNGWIGQIDITSNGVDYSFIVTQVYTFTVSIPLPPCCEDMSIFYRVYDYYIIGYNEGNVTIPFGDIYPATVKKFIDVYKLVEHPGEYTDDVIVEIYTEDFEDPCEINENWLTIDCPIWGDLDGWTWSDKRFCSDGHSMHNTAYDEYLPNQHDILMFGFNQGAGLDISAYDEVEVCWCQWIEGDSINIGNETVPIILLQDYGYFEYSFDNLIWTQAGSTWYNSNGTTETICIDILLDDGSTADDLLFLRWVWFSDPAFCYEGWYIDDVVITGTIYGDTITEPWDEWVWIHDSYDGPVTFDTECLENTYPDVWVADEEGTYMICAWLEAIDNCHFSSTPVDQKYCIVIEIGDILDNAVLCETLEITPASPAFEGDDITATVTVCNVGTLDEVNKQVKMTVNRGSFQVVAEDSFEGETNEPDGVMLRMADSTTPLDDYPTEYVTNAEATRTYWHYTTYDASDGSTALANYHETGAQPWINPYAIFASDYVRGPSLGTGTQIIAAGMSATYDIKANLGAATDRLMWGIIDWNTGWGSYYSLYGVQYWDWTEFEIDISTWVSDITTSSPAYFGVGDTFSCVWRLNKAAPGVGDPACPWNNEWKGMMFDNVKIISLVAEEEVIFSQTQIIPFLNITDCVDLTFTWPDAGVGQYVITIESLVADAVADNNKCITAYNIINVIECAEEMECVDYTGPGQGHWVEESCCGGYFWAGNPATTMYGNDWDDSLYMLNATGGLTFDMSAYATVCVEFDTWFQLNSNDYGYLQISADGGAHWTTVATYFGNSAAFLGADAEGWLIDESYCVLPTNEMQFRFRFISNATGVNRGWFVDNIEIIGDATTVFGPNPALTFEKFYRHETQFGCWWQQPWIEQHFVQDLAYVPDFYWYGAFPPGNSWGVYDPDTYVAPLTYGTPASRSAYPANLDNAVIWTLDVPQAFYGWFDVTTYYDMDGGDYGYIDVSNDGGVTWDNLATEQGSANNDYYGGALSLSSVLANDFQYWGGGSYGLGDYLDAEQLLIRFRFTSDATNLHRYAGWGMFGGVCFYGMNDVNPPVTTAQMTGTWDEECHWYTSCVKIKLDATDDITGVAHTYYELDGVQYEYTQLVSICTDGTHTFCYWSVDNEGNVEEKKCLPEFRIDLTGPTVTITGPTPGLYIFGKKIMELKSGKTIFLFNGIPVTATATADESPVDVVRFYLDDVLMAEDSTAPYSATLSAKHTGPATIKVTAVDGLGHEASDTLNIDNYFKLF